MRTTLLATAAFLGACSVDRSVLDEKIWECESDEDCIDGFGCLDLAPYGPPYCARTADEGCEGVETASGFCLDVCDVGDDGDCRDGYSCVRGFLPSQDTPFPVSSERIDGGYCLPVATCDGSGDCGPGELCASELLGEFADELALRTDALVCLRTCESSRDCESNEICSIDREGETQGICSPRCSRDGTCAPLFSCLDVYEEVMNLGSFCVPGAFPFLPCQDAPGCMVGDCIEALGREQRFCTFEGCEPFCGPEARFGEQGETGLFGVLCDERRDVCGSVLGPFHPCTTDAVDCAEEIRLDERTVFAMDCNDFADDGLPEMCAIECGAFWSCPPRMWCFESAWCVPQLEPGQPCAVDVQCLSGTCNRAERVCD